MDPYPSNYTEAEIAELAAVRRAYPFMVWPAGAGGYAILAERSGARVAGPFSTLHEAYDEVDRMNAPHQGRHASVGGANAAPGRDARLAG
jgi:hypothetical protein